MLGPRLDNTDNDERCGSVALSACGGGNNHAGGSATLGLADTALVASNAYDDGVVNGVGHAVYKGLAMGTVNGESLLYATNLHNKKVDVFDTNFTKPANLQGKFVDPTMPTGSVPFGIAALNKQLNVTYALQDAAQHGEVTGTGLGYVDIFDFGGNFVCRFASGRTLDAP